LPSLKSLVVVAIAWDFSIAVFGMLFSPGFQGLTGPLSLPDSLLRFFYQYEAMFFHALAIPFIAALVYATVGIFGTRGKPAEVVVAAITLGYVISSLSALYILFKGADTLAFETLWVGLTLGVLAALGLLLTTWPRREPGQAAMSLRGRNLASLCVWVSILGVLSAVAVGTYASMGDSMWGGTATIPSMGLIAATHQHVIITIIDAALVALIVKEFRADLYAGIPGTFVKIGLYGTLLGVPTTAISAYATVPYGIAAHNSIIAFAGILLQASLFVFYAVAYVEAKRFGHRLLSGVVANMMTFGMLFILFWVNVVVTLPGIYVAFNLHNFQGLPNEQAFITGHTHVLITLTALTLLMLLAHFYGVKGRLGLVGGLLMTAGYLVSSAATIFYIFMDWNPTTSVYIPYIGAGISLIAIGVVVTVAAIGLSRRNPIGEGEIEGSDAGPRGGEQGVR